MDGYWAILEKLWGKTTTNVVHQVFIWVYATLIIGGFLLCSVMIVSRMLNGMKEHDKDAKTALVDAAKSMIGYILGIFGSALVLVLAAEVFIPLFFSMGYNPDSTST